MSLLQFSTRANKVLSHKALGVGLGAGLLAVLQGCTVVQERRVYVPQPPEPLITYQAPRDNPPVGIPASAGTVVYSAPPEVVYEPVVVYQPAPVVTYESTRVYEPVFRGSIFVGSGSRGWRDNRRNDRFEDYRDRLGRGAQSRRDNDHRDDRDGPRNARDQQGNQHNDRGNGRDQGSRSDREDRGSTPPPPRQAPAPRQEPAPPRPPMGPAPRPAPARAPAGISPLLAQAARDTQANRDKENAARGNATGPRPAPAKNTRKGGSPLVPR